MEALREERDRLRERPDTFELTERDLNVQSPIERKADEE